MDFPVGSIIQAPSNSTEWDEWRKFLDAWRDETKASLKYDGSLYRKPDFGWAAACYSCYFLMLCDETFYSAAEGLYRTEEFLDEGEREFGGYDAVVLWHMRIPASGLMTETSTICIAICQADCRACAISAGRWARGVKVFIDYTPWDTGRRRENKSDREMLAEMVRDRSGRHPSGYYDCGRRCVSHNGRPGTARRRL